jgi:myosin heavy subunit
LAPLFDALFFDFVVVCIDMIEKKMGGMITLLDEEGKVPKGTDEGFIGRLDKQHGRNMHYSTFSKLKPHSSLPGLTDGSVFLSCRRTNL